MSRKNSVARKIPAFQDVIRHFYNRGNQMKMGKWIIRICAAFYIAVSGISPSHAGNQLANGMEKARYELALEDAADEFSIPVVLLKAVAYVESRWNHSIPLVLRDSIHQKSYGIMGLRDDVVFGHSLVRASEMIHAPVEVLIQDPVQNIRGAAAILRSEFEESWNWSSALAAYSGIPGQGEIQLYLKSIEQVLSKGVIAPNILIPGQRFSLGIRWEDELAEKSLDFPAATWDPSPNFDSKAIRPLHVVIHTTQGNFAGAVSWLKNPKARASSHYIIRSRDGYIKQLVREHDRAWHARCWNPYTIGIEHEGFVDQPEWYTDAMVESSASLVRHLLERYGIRPDNMHVVGHDFWSTERFPESTLEQCNDHTDPGRFWNWDLFFILIRPKPF